MITIVGWAGDSDSVLVDENGSSHELNRHSNTQDDDLMLLLSVTFDNVSQTLDESGWTAITPIEVIDATGTDKTLNIWGKYASSESGTYTVSHSAAEDFLGGIITLRDIDLATQFDVSHINRTGIENSETHTPQPITPLNDQALVFSFIGKTGGSNNGTPPSNMTGLIESLGTGQYMGVAYEEVDPATLFTPDDWTDLGTGGDSASITFAVRPSSGGALIPKLSYHYNHNL